MDEHDVTKAEFARFVETTGYVTTAEREINWEDLKKELPPGTPRPDDSSLAPGALVFTPTSGPVPLNNLSAWWRWVGGANWRHPEATAGLISAAGPLQAQDKKPNIVMLMTDDTGWNDFGCYSGLGHPTPNVDQMAKEGRGLLEHFFERDWGDKYAKQQQASGTITK